MRFKSKDLMVSISPNLEVDEEAAAQLCVGGTVICIRPTFDPCYGHTWWGCGPCTFRVSCACTFRGTWGCGFLNSCGRGGSACDYTDICGGYSVWQIEDPSDLVKVREELDDLIKEVDRLQEEGLPTQFRTKEQAEAAEEVLQHALEQVRRQKKSL